MNESPNRRAQDVANTFMIQRMDAMDKRLERHITECTANSKRLFWALVATLGWLVIHSLPFINKLQL